MRGIPVKKGLVLTNFNTKLQPQTKELIDALVAVTGKAGQRELLEDMLVVYLEQHPQEAAKARDYIQYMSSTRPAPAEEPEQLEPQEETPAIELPPSDLMVVTCELEDGTIGLIATTGKSRAAQLLGVTYRYFQRHGAELDTAKYPNGYLKAIAAPEMTFGSNTGTDTWHYIEREAKAYRG